MHSAKTAQSPQLNLQHQTLIYFHSVGFLWSPVM
jgi:hypothetical protein